ncbi:N-6 DNA methylase, partial [Staphylococcus pseudintermedius]
LLSKVMVNLADLPFVHSDMEIDMLGDAYEYLIGRFATNAGKKAGEFYTPQQVSKILAQIVTLGKGKLRNVYDPTCGSGSLLLRVGKETKVYRYNGQERNNTTYNLARMNMLLHNVRYENFDIQNDDTLENPAFLDEQFDAVVANPPY